MDNKDIYQLFINFNVPGVRKEVARLAQGVNTGDAGVMGELLQAAYDPSAGQQALQAGEAVQKPCLANDQSQLLGMFGMFFDKLDARDVKQDTRNTVLYDTMGTLVVAIKENHDVVQQNFQIIQEKLADTDAKMAETDAKIAEIMNALSKVATGSAPANLAMRKNQRYTAESKKITLQWLVKHISNPYPDRDEMECLQNKTGVDTIKRMTSLVTQIRTKEMVKDKNGKWCKRTTTKPSVLGKKRAWTQKNINDMM
jgi:hypothetical protein